MRIKIDLSTVPVGIVIAFAVVLLLEIVLDVVALVDLYRRPVETVALGNKWAWVALIVLVNLIGAVLYFAIGRRPTATVEGPIVQPTRSASEIADSLYGNPDESPQP